jgi:hypothetical protein
VESEQASRWELQNKPGYNAENNLQTPVMDIPDMSNLEEDIRTVNP